MPTISNVDKKLTNNERVRFSMLVAPGWEENGWTWGGGDHPNSLNPPNVRVGKSWYQVVKVSESWRIELIKQLKELPQVVKLLEVVGKAEKPVERKLSDEKLRKVREVYTEKDFKDGRVQADIQAALGEGRMLAADAARFWKIVGGES